MFSVSIAFLFYGVLYFFVIGVYGINDIPRSIGVIQPMLLFFGIVISRLSVKYLFSENYNFKKKTQFLKKILIYGAGRTGQEVAAALDNSNELKVVGFLDDNNLLRGGILQGQNIYSPLELLDLIKSYRSYPEYRNEETLKAIYDGFKNNQPMDLPIVIEFKDGYKRIFSGNTRMDIAFQLGINPKVLLIKSNI
jgi:FlaA1/EpsC-like NDP-sugar epimerase